MPIKQGDKMGHKAAAAKPMPIKQGNKEGDKVAAATVDQNADQPPTH